MMDYFRKASTGIWRINTTKALFLVFLLDCSRDIGVMCDVPRFTVEPQSAYVAVGTSLILSCDVQPESVSMRWILNGSIVHPHRRHGIDVHEGTLRISAFNQPSASNFSHEGVYQCLATNAAGTIVSREARLEAAVLGSFEGVRSVVNIDVVQGNVVVIPCSPPYSKPQAVLEFDFNGTRLVLTDRHMILPSSYLQISDVSESDLGVYQCIAYNPVTGNRVRSPVLQELRVTVPGSEAAPLSPVITWSSSEAVTVVQGHDLTLECAAVGWPVPHVTWEKYGGHLPNGRYTSIFGNLVIRGVQKFDAGTYLCNVNNGVGQPQAKVISVEVLEPPVIETSPTNQNVPEGSSVTFKCRAQGTPRVTVQWLYNANPILTRQFVAIKDTSLTLTNVQSHQRGMYQCIAKNALGMAQASARLIITAVEGVQAGKLTTNVTPTNQDTNTDDEDDDDEEGPRFGVDNQDAVSEEVLMPEEHHIRHNGGTKHVGLSGSSTGHEDDKGPPSSARLLAPSRPEVSRLNENSVLVQWTVAPSGAVPIAAFKVQYKEHVEESQSIWRTIGEDISASQRMYEVTRLRSGSTYRFRVSAVYTNGESRQGPVSHKITMGARTQTQIVLPVPMIVEVRPLTVSELFIGWQMESEQWPIDGFYIHYSPFSEKTEYQRKVVQGSSVRHAILSHLSPGIEYSIRMQSFSATLGESEFSNAVVKQTLSPYGDSPSLVGSPDNIKSDVALPARSPSRPSQSGRNRNTVSGGGADLDFDDRGSAPGRINSEAYSPPAVLIGENGGENQVLYIALGTVLGVVVLVTVLCIVTCTWKQHQRQRVLATAKERQSLQQQMNCGINPVINSMMINKPHQQLQQQSQAMTSSAALSSSYSNCEPTMDRMHGQLGFGSGLGRDGVQLGSYSSPLHGRDTAAAAALALRDNAAAYQLVPSGTVTSSIRPAICVTNKKIVPELTLPPPPPLPHAPPLTSNSTSASIPNHQASFLLPDNNSPDIISEHNGSYNPLGHVYSRLQNLDGYSTKPSFSPTSADRVPVTPARSQPGNTITSFQGQGSGPLSQSHSSSNASQGDGNHSPCIASARPRAPSPHGGSARISPDHIPRSHERHPYWSGANVPNDSPRWSALAAPGGSQCSVVGRDSPLMRRNNMIGGNAVVAGSDCGNFGVGTRVAASNVSHWNAEVDDGSTVLGEEEQEENMMRDQGTNTDVLSNHGATSVYTESDSNNYSSLDRPMAERLGDIGRRGADDVGSQTSLNSPGTSVCVGSESVIGDRERFDSPDDESDTSVPQFLCHGKGMHDNGSFLADSYYQHNPDDDGKRRVGDWFPSESKYIPTESSDSRGLFSGSYKDNNDIVNKQGGGSSVGLLHGVPTKINYARSNVAGYR